MKRILVFSLAIVMLLSFAACGGKTGIDSPATAAPADGAEETQPAGTEAPADATPDDSGSAAPAAAALIPGALFQIDPEAPVLRGLALAGNRAGTEAFNAALPGNEGIRCIFELNEWVEVTPDTDAEDGLAVWVFRHAEDPTAYAGMALSEEAPGFAAYCALPFDAEAQDGASRGSFYLNPEDCEAGYYDLVFSLDGSATAVLLARFYNEAELENKTDDELMAIQSGLE